MDRRPRWIEDAEVEGALENDQQQRDGDHRSAQQHDDAGGVMGPDEQRQAGPGHPGARMRWMVTTKFSPVRMEEKPDDEDAAPASMTWVLLKAVLKGV